MNVFQFSLRIIVAEYGNALQYNYMTLKFLVFLNSSQIFFNEDYAALIAVLSCFVFFFETAIHHYALIL